MRLTTWLVLCLSSTSVFSQTVVREYFDHQGEKCIPETSYYYSVGKQNSRGVFYDSVISYYTRSNSMRSIEVLDQFGSRMGNYESYYENGTLKSRIRYDKKSFRILNTTADSTDFIILTFNDSLNHPLVTNGQGFVRGRLDFLVELGKVVNGRRDSVWTVFQDNGKVFSYESWQAGELIDGVSYDETGKEYYFKELTKLPAPVEGLSEFYDRISDNITYPRDAERRGIEGKIIIEFSIEKDGTITSPHVLQSLGFGCDDEAIKALISSPRWQPCKQRGQPVKYKMTIPFLFKLS